MQNVSKYITAQPNQNLWDITLQEFGTIEAIFTFMAANGIDGLDSVLVANRRYKVPSDAIIQRSIKDHFEKTGTKIVTGYRNVRITEEEGIRITEEGGTRIIE
jgi:hypothetical protein